MKKTLTLLLTLALLFTMTACSNSSSITSVSDTNAPEPVADAVYTQTIGAVETLAGTMINNGHLQYAFGSKEEAIYQVNTLTLKADGEYELVKLVHSSEEDGLSLEYSFIGQYQQDGDTVMLGSASTGTASIFWGELSGSYGSEDGDYSSDDKPELLSHFNTPYLGEENGNIEMEILLNDEDQSFIITSTYSMLDSIDIEVNPDSPLKGKNMIFLGSSVTHGVGREGISFVEILGIRHEFEYIKEAVPGTTLVDNGESSYIQRMLNIDTSFGAEAFVCQLSTNDASTGKPLGEMSASYELDDFDTSTISGAIEYILAYVQETWGCPVVFYTGTFYESEPYGEMVDQLYVLQGKWDNLYIIDMWNQEDMRDIDDDLYAEYMNDPIHPSLKGYMEWWVPMIESELYTIIE